MRHNDPLYRDVDAEHRRAVADADANYRARRKLYEGASDLVLNHLVPVLGVLPHETQMYLKTHYDSLRALDPKRATLSSALYLGAGGIVLAQLLGDGGLGITYEFPHKLPGGQVVNRPVYFPFGNWSPSMTKIVAGIVIADSTLRVGYALFRKRGSGFGKSLADGLKDAASFIARRRRGEAEETLEDRLDALSRQGKIGGGG